MGSTILKRKVPERGKGKEERGEKRRWN